MSGEQERMSDRLDVAECETCGEASAGHAARQWMVDHIRETGHRVMVIGHV